MADDIKLVYIALCSDQYYKQLNAKYTLRRLQARYDKASEVVKRVVPQIRFSQLKIVK